MLLYSTNQVLKLEEELDRTCADALRLAEEVEAEAMAGRMAAADARRVVELHEELQAELVRTASDARAAQAELDATRRAMEEERGAFALQLEEALSEVGGSL